MDVQSGPDYLRKVVRYAIAGYRLNVHVNAMSKKGYLLAMIAVLVGRILARPTFVTFHGGLSQDYFPRLDSWKMYQAFWLLFCLAGAVACDSAEIKQAIEGYGIPPTKVMAIATFSPQYLQFEPAIVPAEAGGISFSAATRIFFLCLYRPEYRLEIITRGHVVVPKKVPSGRFHMAGFPWQGIAVSPEFRGRVGSKEERDSLVLLGNLSHDQFLTLMTRCVCGTAHTGLRWCSCFGT